MRTVKSIFCAQNDNVRTERYILGLYDMIMSESWRKNAGVIKTDHKESFCR
jgi:hypothetical protein